MIRSSAFGFTLSALLIAAAGCGPARGSVSGQVTYQGKAVGGGTVTIIASDGLT